ncbi:predicted protein [Micromonas commoda]|uniref:Bulb-type lectin domain-containing protein n=1 Tax=Micromonas commoda (strain RCC299 / NOUM17 / CCMP2709) TaxID=296587 RepID=C1DZ93_MICCC|nr:predicted protein [Micromonas commoda]ACO61074.1 predicted protein [Micromonas commoda]|eukprot:XP_002499816.1 predicted protein [Micromonas commoda]
MRLSQLVVILALATLATHIGPAKANLWAPLGAELGGTQNGEQFGSSVSLNRNGTIMAVGAPRYGGYNDYRGRVQVYRLDAASSVWTEMGPAIEGSKLYANFGQSVSLSADGTRLAVSSLGDPAGIYSWQASNATWDLVSFSLPCGSCLFTAAAMSADGTRFAALTKTSSFPDAAYVFSSSTLANISHALSPVHSFYGGKAIALSANGIRVALGGRTGTGWGSNGFVKVFEEAAGHWSQLGGDINTESGEHYASFGEALALSADGLRLVVGAPGVVEPSGYSYTGGAGSGVGAEPYVVVYDYDASTNTWGKLGGLMTMGQARVTTSHNYYHFFGKGVSISDDGSMVAVGVDSYHPYSGTSVNGPGFARLYKWSQSWDKVEDFSGNSTAENAGRDVSLSGDGRVMVVGKPYTHSSTEPGYVRVYGKPEVASPSSANSSISSNSSYGGNSSNSSYGGNSNNGNGNNNGSGNSSSTSSANSSQSSGSNASAVPPPPPPPSPPPKIVLDDDDHAVARGGFLLLLVATAIHFVM